MFRRWTGCCRFCCAWLRLNATGGGAPVEKADGSAAQMSSAVSVQPGALTAIQSRNIALIYIDFCQESRPDADRNRARGGRALGRRSTCPPSSASAGSFKGKSDLTAPCPREGWPNYVSAFHDGDEIGPRMLARIAKHTGLTPDDL